MITILPALLGFFGSILGAVVGAYAAWHISAQQAKNQFRLAALDKRLEAHQTAYALWHELLGHIWKEDISDIVSKCEEWSKSHRIYLSTESSEAFRDAYRFAFNFSSMHRDDPKTDEAWAKIMGAGDVIVRDVSLPAINGGEISIRRDPPLSADGERPKR